MSNPLSDLEKADVYFCIGTNMTECHPVAATRMKKALARGSKLIVADPRYIKLAEMSDLYLPLRVGTDVALLLGMAHVIVRENLLDHKFIEERTNGIEEYIAHVKQFTPEWASEITGVPAKDIEKAAIMYASADKASIYYTLGITEHICGVDNVQSLSNLALMTGHLGREGCGINPLRGQNNIQGAGDSGAIPNNCAVTASGVYDSRDCGQTFRTSRWATMQLTASAMNISGIPNSRNTSITAAQLLACIVLTTRIPVRPARTAIWPVSESRISPTIMTSGS